MNTVHERNQQQRELKREQDQQNRRDLFNKRNGGETAQANQADEFPQKSEAPPTESAQPLIPDHAIKVSLGASVSITRHPTYTRKGRIVDDLPKEISGTVAPSLQGEDHPKNEASKTII